MQNPPSTLLRWQVGPSDTTSRVPSKWWATILFYTAGGLLPFLLAVFDHYLWEDWRYESEVLHGVVEGVGAFSALVASALLCLQLRRSAVRNHYLWLASSLGGMGVLGLFHSLEYRPLLHAWFELWGSLVGGFLAFLVWLPDRVVGDRLRKYGPAFVWTVSLGFALGTPDLLDDLLGVLTDGEFYHFAQIANTVGGLFFLLAAARLFWRFQLYREPGEILFANFCLLSGTSAMLFHITVPWGDLWWFWHGIQLLGSLFALGYIFLAQDYAVRDLTRSEERFRLVFENAPSGVLLVGSDRAIRRVNQVFSRMLGYDDPSELMGRDISDFTHPEDQGRVHRLAESVREGRVGRLVLEKRYVGRHQDVVWGEVMLTKLNLGGDEFMLLAMVNDITERKRTESELLRLNETLEQKVSERSRELAERADELKQINEHLSRSNRDLEQFAYVASHDLKEPLRMVTSYVQLLKRRFSTGLDQDAQDFMKFAVEGAYRMNDLIDDLLAFAQLDRKDGGFRKVDFTRVFTRVEASLGQAIAESGAVLSVGKLPEVVVDEMQVEQLLQNLVSNAIKYRGKKKPKIRVEARRSEGEWIFSVSDNGIGIEPQYSSRIFKLFQRLHSKEEYPGTGIGLAICQRIAERHGGRIWVESVLGQGSTFYFSLPDQPVLRLAVAK